MNLEKKKSKTNEFQSQSLPLFALVLLIGHNCLTVSNNKSKIISVKKSCHTKAITLVARAISLNLFDNEKFERDVYFAFCLFYFKKLPFQY